MIPSDFPTVQELFDCILEKAKASKGDITNQEFELFAIERLQINDDHLALIHSGNRTELSYRLAWARTKASKVGVIQRVGRGVWRAR